MNPLPLPVNVIDHFYRGGERIAALRGIPPEPEPRQQPEEWLASTVSRWGWEDVGIGLTDLDVYGPLADAIAADPEAWLGRRHVARWGTSTSLLVKLLDAGQRLPVHAHPTRSFAARHLGCPFGKSEAWVVIEGGTVFVGATRPVPKEEWAGLVADQDTDTMLELLHPVAVRPGDGVFVPSGTPHAIGEGLFVVELQEPTDFSVLLEWRGFDVDGANAGHLGLGFDVALDAVRRDCFDAATVDRLVRHAGAGDDDVRRVLADVGDPYFRAWWVAPRELPVGVPQSFSVVVVLDGAGTVAWTYGYLPIDRGDAMVVPHGAGSLTFDGPVTAIVAQPPDPEAPDPVEWDVAA